MKKPALVLLPVLALLLSSALFAQEPQVTPPPAASTPAPLAAPFLAPLPSPVVPPPLFMTDGCTSSSQCPTGQLCCWVCGNPPADEEISCRACVTPVKGRCPMVV